MPIEFSRQDQRRAVLGIAGYLRRRVILDNPITWTLLEYGSGFRVDLEQNQHLIGFLYSQPQMFPTYYVPIHDTPIYLTKPGELPIPEVQRIELVQTTYGVGKFRAWVFLEERYHIIARADYAARGEKIANGQGNDYFKRTTAR